MGRQKEARVPTYHRAGSELSGHIMARCGVFASLDEPADTTCTAKDTWYPIEGDFTNSPEVNFEAVGGELPGIVLGVDAGCNEPYEVDWHASVIKASGTTVVSMGIMLNGVIDPRSVMTTTVTTLILTMSGTTAVTISPGDKVSLVVSSNTAGDVLSVEHYTTTIRKFFASPA